MRIIFITTKPITFNTFLKKQADFFLNNGLKIFVASRDHLQLNLETTSCYEINFPQNKYDFFNFFNYFKILKQINFLVKKYPSDIYYLHTPIAAHIFRLFTFFYGLKIVYFVHGFRFTPNTNLIKKTFFKSIEKILSYNTNIFLTINNHDFDYVASNFKKKSFFFKVNGIGIDVNLQSNKNNLIEKKSINKILVIAAYKKDKGYLELLQVADILRKTSIKIECYGYGNFNLYKKIKNKKKLKNINFKGFDKNLKNKIKDYDILLHLSKREGLPVSVMQALSQGLPVICYDIRGNNDLITNKVNGFFVKSFRDVPGIIHYLNLENKIFNQMRFNSIESINEEYSHQSIYSSILKIFNNYIYYNK